MSGMAARQLPAREHLLMLGLLETEPKQNPVSCVMYPAFTVLEPVFWAFYSISKSFVSRREAADSSKHTARRSNSGTDDLKME
jgi:hypothetical protein